jgi:CRISPR-associated protein Cas6/Cse3/CasE subtype I-E
MVSLLREKKMHYFNIRMPSSLANYEIHRHLHVLFNNDGRDFLYHRDGDLVHVISKTQPRMKSKTISVSNSLYSFILRAAVTKKPMGKKNRIDLLEKSERLKWIKRKIYTFAEVEFVDVIDAIDTSKNDLKRIYASFSGIIRVIDSDGFNELILNGVGKERAFGCGMFYFPEVMR